MKRTLALILALLLLVCFPATIAADLVSLGNGTVQDTDNSLIWIEHPFARATWAGATTASAALTFAGISNWRLPTKTELLTLVDTTKSPKIDPLINLGSVSNWACWTSTTVTDSGLLKHQRDKARAYLVFFGDGRAFDMPKKARKASLYVSSYSAGWAWHSGDDISWHNGVNIGLH